MDKVRIGRVVKPHGVRGEVVVEVTTDDVNRRFAPGSQLDGVQGTRGKTLTVRGMRPHQGRMLIAFEEITDRTSAESLRGLSFYAEPLPEEDGESFYDDELVGLAVHNGLTRIASEGCGPSIGHISGVQHTPAGQLLEVLIDEGSNLPNAGRSVLIPFKRPIVPIVDLEAGLIVIKPPEGLLEL
ncbi:ribosome maturation factor RimM [Corynebacterium heidelbergense]|uniref:Ribosome maturation factor RimM n=1 Tax=Corynebacterium heidelbergense TaxID=2055947 RepID=A0A364VD21_9CORY|nr:ribosome maturation factor RimM [Corynebacterium heidelbergense]RAV34466.1 ribosome maturation factor RimM [Corynebacterium heidelbergense]WCZ36776.1 Ribosome maturation factor RimM [Corynebacterium heidelbergense]